MIDLRAAGGHLRVCQIGDQKCRSEQRDNLQGKQNQPMQLWAQWAARGQYAGWIQRAPGLSV